jgi:broad specificity phosphatase PhoE
MELILIRHGQTEWNATSRWQGQADPPLNAVGHEQAQHTAQELSGQKIDVLISSDLKRARETAEIIAATLSLEVRFEPRLREINLGDWQGLYSTEIRARWPQEVEAWHDSPLSVRPPHGETIAELADRVLKAVEDIAQHYPQQRVGIVAHELPIAVITTHAAGIPLAELRQHIPPNAAWREVEWPAKL